MARPRPRTPAGEGQTCHPAVHGRGITHRAGPAHPAGVDRLKPTVPIDQPHEQAQSLYRRHRPRTFAEVVGQEPVVRTLRNAVQREKVHHAYLFVGSRGTGKTSMAKILAACLNCERGAGGSTTDPCGECESCVSIARATSLDVIEMDAASNNSVDDIRELRESVAYSPVSGRSKVYILDEAHMLSTAAWNAFLEDPRGAAAEHGLRARDHRGTEGARDGARPLSPLRLPPTHGRADRKRPAPRRSGRVDRDPPDALVAVARSATGSFRDALGTLEQLLTYSGPEIALQDVLAVLGVADARLLEETVDAVAAGDLRARRPMAPRGVRRAGP